MIQKKAVSVIIPIYNTGKYLKQCMDSIINQSLKDIEIICVNDGSTDNSLDILKEYSNIKIINQKNQGLSIARNTGLKYANGEYIYFCDSDDFLQLDALENLYLFAKYNNLDILYFDGVAFFESEELKNKFHIYKNAYIRHKDYGIEQSGLKMLHEMFYNGDYYTASPFQLIKKEYLDKINLHYYPNILYEDYLFNFQCMLQANKVGHMPKQYYNRRIRNNSIVTSNNGIKYILSLIIIYGEMKRFVSTFPRPTHKYDNVINLVMKDVLNELQKAYNNITYK